MNSEVSVMINVFVQQGATHISHVQKCLQFYLEHVLFAGKPNAPRSCRAFYRTREDIRSHIQQCIHKDRYNSVDQVNTGRLVQEPRENHRKLLFSALQKAHTEILPPEINADNNILEGIANECEQTLMLCMQTAFMEMAIENYSGDVVCVVCLNATIHFPFFSCDKTPTGYVIVGLLSVQFETSECILVALQIIKSWSMSFDPRGTSEKVSLFYLPSDADKREQWKRAIPRQEAGGFSFDSHHVRVCEKHFDTADVVWNDTFLVKGDVVSLRREKPKLRPDAVPRRFDGVPAYLSKPKPRSRSTRVQPATKRRRLSSPDDIAEEILPCSSTEASQTAVTSAADAAVGIGVYAETACQTEEVVCPIYELLAVKGQLRSTTQRLRRSQMKLAKMTALASRHKKQHTDTQKLSAREKLIFDQCLMKANAKSPTAVSIEGHIKAIRQEMLKAVPNEERVRDSMPRTFKSRRQYIAEERPLLRDLFERYSALASKEIFREFEWLGGHSPVEAITHFAHSHMNALLDLAGYRVEARTHEILDKARASSTEDQGADIQREELLVVSHISF
ncbi:hypothetical protein HPB48_019337 [Haemaphysalis longicornis]|uniref:THAP-type domain-containing protein n=1 Tax=Haemaphysalis longicornis TaxID=44386 RepID=A0A9J6G999_HAELO|nr:hypothetical protein HPB48_019337 [Haemaphysalis longicornis]